MIDSLNSKRLIKGTNLKKEGEMVQTDEKSN